MKVRLANHTPNPVEEIYKGYRICYAKGEQDDIKIPMIKDENIDWEYADIEKMSNFIKPLMANGHTSPLEHVSLTFYLNGISRVTETQLVRHRTGKFNIQSGRYVNREALPYVTPQTIIDAGMQEQYDKHMLSAMELYNRLVKNGVPKEDARYMHPQATSTNITVTMDLNNFRKFYALRGCVNAQWEIRAVADEMMRQVKEVIPFADYQAKGCGRTCDECFQK